jgi:chemotaxis protein CheX
MKKILVVDDDNEFRESLVEMIHQVCETKVEVIEARDGLEALRKVENEKFDIIITDMEMPKYDGNSLVRMISVMKQDLRPDHILVMSEFKVDGQMNSKTKISYLAKPINKEQMQGFMGQALKNETKEPFKIDVNFILPFVESTLEVLKLTASTPATKEKVYVKTGNESSGDISAIVSMNSPKFLGSFAISFEEACFLEVVSNMLMEEYQAINEENRDAVGEICNQVFGMAKARMNDEMGLDIAKAIPTVIEGKKHTIKHMIDGKCLTVKFNTKKGSFTIEAVVQPLE